jgi:hypothetical protein
MHACVRMYYTCTCSMHLLNALAHARTPSRRPAFAPSLTSFPPPPSSALWPLSLCFARQVQKYVLAQYAAILPNDAAARKAFMQTGLLQRVQELKLSAGPKVAESISRINAAFPTECVKFSDPSYARELVSKLEE